MFPDGGAAARPRGRGRHGIPMRSRPRVVYSSRSALSVDRDPRALWSPNGAVSATARSSAGIRPTCPFHRRSPAARWSIGSPFGCRRPRPSAGCTARPSPTAAVSTLYCPTLADRGRQQVVLPDPRRPRPSAGCTARPSPTAAVSRLYCPTLADRGHQQVVLPGPRRLSPIARDPPFGCCGALPPRALFADPGRIARVCRSGAAERGRRAPSASRPIDAGGAKGSEAAGFGYLTPGIHGPVYLGGVSAKPTLGRVRGEGGVIGSTPLDRSSSHFARGEGARGSRVSG